MTCCSPEVIEVHTEKPDTINVLILRRYTQCAHIRTYNVIVFQLVRLLQLVSCDWMGGSTVTSGLCVHHGQDYYTPCVT